MLTKELLYFPCIADSSGRIRRKVSNAPMSRNSAETYLKTHYARQWLKCEAIPQPETMKHYIY